MKKLWYWRVPLGFLIIVIELCVIAFLRWHTLSTWINQITDEFLNLPRGLVFVVGSLLGLVGSLLVTVTAEVIKDRRNRDHERRVKHYNGVIKLQWQLNEARAILEDNAFALNELISMNSKGMLTPKRPQLLPIDHASYDALYDLTLVNMINDCLYDARRLNLDSRNLTKAVDQLTDLYLSGQINQSTFKANAVNLNDGIKKLRKSFEDSIEQLILPAAAYVRLCADQDATPEMRRRFRRMTNGRKPITDTDVKTTVAKIKKELTEREAEFEKKRTGIGV